jgi:hypothetical protein
VVYLVAVTFSWFFKVHFDFLSLKCKSWIISVVFCSGLPCHSYIFLIFQSSFWFSFIEMQELEYFSSVLSWFTLSQLHSLDFSKFILDFSSWNARVGIFQKRFVVAYLVTVIFYWFFKVHLGFLLLKWKSGIISVVFCRSFPCHSYIPLIFQSSFGFLSLNCKSWNISVVFCCGLLCHTYILTIFQSSFWLSFIEMQESEYFSSVLSWFTLLKLHSLNFSKYILDFFCWNARVGIFQ